jgi:hypothetical protein
MTTKSNPTTHAAPAIEERELPGTALDELAAPPAEAPSPSEAMLIGECIDARHPTLIGRALIRIPRPGAAASERWVPTLMNLPVREGDRVLLARPGNFAEPVVVGVLDGFTSRPEPARVPAATRSLAVDEVVRFEGPRGEPLVEIGPGERGPVVRLLSPTIDVETPGAVRVRADSIELHARQGPIHLQAQEDVVLQGEAIHLN